MEKTITGLGPNTVQIILLNKRSAAMSTVKDSTNALVE